MVKNMKTQKHTLRALYIVIDKFFSIVNEEEKFFRGTYYGHSFDLVHTQEEGVKYKTALVSG